MLRSSHRYRSTISITLEQRRSPKGCEVLNISQRSMMVLLMFIRRLIDDRIVAATGGLRHPSDAVPARYFVTSITSATPTSTRQNASRNTATGNLCASATPHDTLRMPPTASGMPVAQSTLPAWV